MNKFLNCVLRESPLDSPFALRKKYDSGGDPLGAGASVLNTVIGGLFSSGQASRNRALARELNEKNIAMQRETNELNALLQREANEQNYRIFQEGNQFNLDMWNRQNQYNLPSAQVARLKAAGINPYAVYGNGSVSEAGGISAASPSQMQAADMVAPRADQAYYDDPGRGFNQAMTAFNAFAEARLKNAQVKNLETEGEVSRGRLDLDRSLGSTNIKYLEELSKKEGWLGDLAKEQLNYERASQKYRLGLLMGDMRQQSENFRSMQVLRSGYELQNKMYEVQLAYAPKLNDAQLSQYYATVGQLKAQIGLINANKMLTDEQRETEIQKRVGVIIDNGLKGFDFKLKDEMKNITLSLAREELYEKEDNRMMRPFDFEHRMSGKAGQWFPVPVGEYEASKIYERNKKRDAFKQ